MTSSIAFDVIARDKASSTFSRIGRSSDSTMKKLTRFGKSTAGLVGFTSLTAAAVGFIKVGASYSTSLNKIQALSGVTDGKLKDISSTLEGQSGQFAKMGQTTGDAAAGMVELVKAGLSADNALKAVSQTMVLAKAGELDIADASSLVANTLNTFGLKANQAGKIANYLANAANISSADVTDLAESLKYVAPVAAGTGVSLKQTSAILAELSNSGIAASNAGTGFRKFLLSLQAPSGAAKTDLHDLGVEIFDASGKMKPLGTVIDTLNGKLSKLTDQKRQKILKDIFGLQGISSASVILKGGAKGLETYAKGVSRAGAAQKLAEAQSKGFMGTLRQLRAEVISSAQAAYRDLEPSLNAAAKSLEKFLNQMKTGKGAGGDFVNALKDLAAVAKTAASILNGLPGPVKKFGIEGLIAYAVIRKLTVATGGWGASLTSGIAKTKQFGAEMTYSATRMGALSGGLQALGGALRNAAGAGGMLLLADGAGKAGTKMGLLESAAGGALSGAALGAFAGPEGAAVGAAIGGLAGGALSLARNTKSAADSARDALGKWSAYKDTLDAVTGATTEATRQFALQRLQQSGVLKNTEALGISDRTVVNAVVNGGKARSHVIALLEKERTGLAANVAAKQAEVSANLKQTTDYQNLTSVQRKAAADRAFAAKRELDDLKARQKARNEDIDATERELGVVDKAVKAKRADAAAITDLTGKLKGIPKSTATKIKAEGIIPTTKGIISLSEKYHLTPKQVKTVITASGVPLTKKQIDNLIKTVETYGKLNPKPHLDADTAAAAAKIKALIDGIARLHDKTIHINTYTNANVGEHNSGGKKDGGGSNGRVVGSSSNDRVVRADGQRTASAYADGIHLGAQKVKKALDKLQDMASAAANKLASLKDIKAGFLSTFSADSIFGADLSGGGGIGSLIAMEQQQASRASQLVADIKRVASMGLSKSLISQLQSQGTSGAEALHVLASGSSAQIAQLNSLNAQTQGSLQNAGMLAGNLTRGGSINADIAAESRQEALIERLIKRLHKMDDEIVVEIDGEAIIRAIKRRNKRKGVASANL